MAPEGFKPFQLCLGDPERFRGDAPSRVAVRMGIPLLSGEQSSLWHLAVNKQAFFFTIQTETPTVKPVDGFSLEREILQILFKTPGFYLQQQANPRDCDVT